MAAKELTTGSTNAGSTNDSSPDKSTARSASVSVDVVLDKPHMHAGRPRPVGAIISVSRPEAEFLLKNKVIKTIPAV